MSDEQLRRMYLLACLRITCNKHIGLCGDCQHKDPHDRSCMVRVFFLGDIPSDVSFSDTVRASNPGAVPDDLWEGLKEGVFGKVDDIEPNSHCKYGTCSDYPDCAGCGAWDNKDD